MRPERRGTVSYSNSGPPIPRPFGRYLVMHDYNSNRDDSAQLDEFRLLRLPEVLRLCGISRSALYEMIARGDFPRPVRIGSRSVGWRLRDIRTWLDNRPPATDNPRRKRSA